MTAQSNVTLNLTQTIKRVVEEKNRHESSTLNYWTSQTRISSGLGPVAVLGPGFETFPTATRGEQVEERRS